MPILNLKITNPQALDLIRRFRSGELLAPLLGWLKKNRWYLASLLAVIVLLIALAVGKRLAELNSNPLPPTPDIESPLLTVTPTLKSDFSGLKEEIENCGTALPDPYIPVLDNLIDLEPTITP